MNGFQQLFVYLHSFLFKRHDYILIIELIFKYLNDLPVSNKAPLVTVAAREVH